MFEHMLEETTYLFDNRLIRTCQPAECVWELTFEDIVWAS